MKPGTVALMPYVGESLAEWLRRIAKDFDGKGSATRAVLVFCDVDADGAESTGYCSTRNLGRPSELVGLLETAKHDILEQVR